MILGLSAVSCGGGLNKIGEGVNQYFDSIINPGDKDIYEWKSSGFKDRAEISKWRNSGCRDPKKVRKLIDRGLTFERYSKYHNKNKCDFNAWNDYLNEYDKVVLNKKNKDKLAKIKVLADEVLESAEKEEIEIPSEEEKAADDKSKQEVPKDDKIEIDLDEKDFEDVLSETIKGCLKDVDIKKSVGDKIDLLKGIVI